MAEIAHGIDIHYQNKIYTVIFADGQIKNYSLGNLLFEFLQADVAVMLTEKVLNMIQIFPDFNKELSVDSITDGFQWLYATIENYPVVTEIFRSHFNAVLQRTISAGMVQFDYTGAFFLECFDAYMTEVQLFATYLDAIAAVETGCADEKQKSAMVQFLESETELYSDYKKKDMEQKMRGKMKIGIHNIVTILDILFLEHSKLTKEHKAIRKCLWCGRYFIPQGRRDTKYCDAPAPDKPEYTCSKRVQQQKKSDRKENPLALEHDRKMAYLKTYANRYAAEGNIEMYDCYMKEHKNEIERYKKQKQQVEVKE